MQIRPGFRMRQVVCCNAALAFLRHYVVQHQLGLFPMLKGEIKLLGRVEVENEYGILSDPHKNPQLTLRCSL